MEPEMILAEQMLEQKRLKRWRQRSTLGELELEKHITQRRKRARMHSYDSLQEKKPMPTSDFQISAVLNCSYQDMNSYICLNRWVG